MVRIEATAEASLAAILERIKLGIAMAAMIKMIATTISNSISEKPFCLLRICIQFSLDFRCTEHASISCIAEAIVATFSRKYRMTMKIGKLFSLRSLNLLEIALHREATVVNPDDNWRGRLTVSVTRNRRTSRQQAWTMRERGPKNGARNRGSVLCVSLCPTGGRQNLPRAGED